MAAAEVGDDVYGDDPTVNRLQSVAAERFGIRGALFFRPGRRAILRPLWRTAAGAMNFWSGKKRTPINTSKAAQQFSAAFKPQPLEHEPDGGIAIERIAAAIKPDDYHFARTRLLALENTIGGRVLPAGLPAAATEFAHSRGLGTHLGRRAPVQCHREAED